MRWERGESVAGKLKPGPGKSPEDVARIQRGRVQDAMAEILTEHAYEAITVRMLIKRAGVSTRTFYECYSGKEECFLGLHWETVRRLLWTVGISQAGAVGVEGRTRRTVTTLWGELAGNPTAARLVLIDVSIAGPAAQAQARRAYRSIGTTMANCVDGSLAGTARLRFLARGVASGLLGMARSYLLNERVPALPELSEELSDWAVACLDPSFETRDRPSVSSVNIGVPCDAGAPIGNEAALLAAAVRIGATEDPSAMSARNLLAEAGLPRRALTANFASLEDCVARALDVQVEKVIARTVRAAAGGPLTPRQIARSVAVFCQEMERAPAFARFCFGRLATSNVREMIHRESIKTKIGHLIEQAIGSSPTHATDRLRVEASAAACWGLLEEEMVQAGRVIASRLAPVLTHLIIAPAAEGAKADHVFGMEYDFA